MLDKEMDKLAAETKLMAPQFRSAFSSMETDVLVLSRLPPIQGLIHSLRNNDLDPRDGSTTTLWRNRLETIFKSMMDPKKHYVQIRYIGVADGGRELVRVNRTETGLEAVPPEDLQPKGQESYFQEGLKLKPGEIYYSAVNLNREHGRVQEPYLPVIRVVFPVYDDTQNLFGMLVINASYDKFLRQTLSTLDSDKDIYVIDDRGDYLVSSKLKYISAFRLPGFLKEVPEHTPVIEALEHEKDSEGTVFTVVGGIEYLVQYYKLFFDPLHPDRFINTALSVPKGSLIEKARQAGQYSLVLSGFLIFFTALLAAFFARYMTGSLKQTIHEIRAYANGKETLSLPVTLNDEIGELARAFEALTHDLSTTRQAEKQLVVRLQSILDNTLDGLITIDEQGTIKHYNKACTEIFGYRESETIGQNIKMLMPEPYRGEHDGYLKNYRHTGKAQIIGIGREVQGRRKDGTIFPLHLAVNEINLDGERLFSGIVRDITIRKRAEEEREKYMRSLQRSNKELDDFAYIASHDLKEPLRGLANNARFLREDYEGAFDEDGQKRLDRMEYLCTRMETLVNDLLYFSRLGRQELAVQSIDLNEVIKDIETMMENTLEEENAKIVIPHPLPTITCDVPRVTEVLRNLITNAVKYNDSTEKIVEVGRADPTAHKKHKIRNQYIFYVKDNGIGIKHEFFDDIFRIFKRLNIENDTAKGTGVGLTFVKKIIERHGGKIWLESEEGHGTTFYFTLGTTTES